MFRPPGRSHFHAWLLLATLLVALVVGVLCAGQAEAEGYPDADTVQLLIIDRAAAHGVDPAVLLCTAQRESRFNPTSRGGLGERGIAQWLGGSGDKNAWDETSAAHQGIDIRRLYTPDPLDARRYVPADPNSVYFDVDAFAELVANGRGAKHWSSTLCR